ncbi:MAG: hypothetical protein ACKVS8_06160 [Phycisphaerales bacterium]
MKNGIAAIVLSTVAGLASVAHADLTFSFADPIPGRQLVTTANAGGPGLALVSYDPLARLQFLVDGSTEPMAFEALFDDARLSLDLTLGPAITSGGITTASILGSFAISDATVPGPAGVIVSGFAQDGAFVRIGGTSSILFSTETGFGYTAGPRLAALLAPDRVITDPMEAVFTVTGISVTGGGPLLNQDGSFRSFTANASFSGNSAVENRIVPTPGSALLAVTGALVIARRRRA